MSRKKQAAPLDFGPDPYVDGPDLSNGGAMTFLQENLLPLLYADSGEKVFAQKGEVLLRELWRRSHSYRPPNDRERRGRPSEKITALTAIVRGLEKRTHGRAGGPTQGDMERILEASRPELDEDTRRKYARLYQLTVFMPTLNISERDWFWLAKHDPDFVRRAFFTLWIIRDAAKQRGFPENANEKNAVSAYVRICNALQRKGGSFSAPSFTEVIHFGSRDCDK